VTDGTALLLGTSFAAGALLALIYLWSLRATVEALPAALRPARRIAGSLLVRLLAVCAAFYTLARVGGAPAMLTALLGFALVRTVVVSRIRQGLDHRQHST
jgi:F1F0 ATPase subunit 2